MTASHNPGRNLCAHPTEKSMQLTESSHAASRGSAGLAASHGSAGLAAAWPGRARWPQW